MNIPWTKLKLLVYSIFTNNFPLKVLSLILAFSVWQFAPIASSKNSIKLQLFVPVSYTNQPTNLIMTSTPPRSLKIQVMANQQIVNKLVSGKLSASIDLSDATLGKYQKVITSANLNLPHTVKLLQITPQNIPFTFANTASKTVPITPVFSGKPATGYLVKKWNLSIKEITITGSEKEIKPIKRILTQAISLKKLNQNTQLPVTLSFPGSVRSVINEPYIMLYLTIASRLVGKRITNIPIGLVNQQYITQINPWRLNILVKAPQAKLDKLNKKHIQAFIDLSGYKPGKYKIKHPQITLDQDIQVEKTWPPINLWILNKKLK